MKKFILILALLMPVSAFADAGTIATTSSWLNESIKVIKITWTSTAAGEVYGNIGEVFGKIWGVFTDPSAVAALVPTDNYDIYLRDYGVPTAVGATGLVGTQLENRDQANNEFVYLSADVRAYRPVGFSISASGDVTSGDCWIYVEVPR